MSGENQSPSQKDFIANARDNAKSGKYVNLPTIEAVAYIDKKSGDLAIAAKSPEAIAELSTRSMGKDAIVLNNALPKTNVMYYSSDKATPGLTAIDLASTSLKNLGVPKEDIDKVANLAANQEKGTKDAGKYVSAPDKIPHEIKAFVDKRLGQDAKGDPRVDDQGNTIKPSVFPAKENGSYKGKVILNTETHLVQSIGKDEKTAVVHDKANLELMGERLKWRDANQKLHNADIQIHYQDGKGKAYPLAKDNEKPQQAASLNGLNPEKMLEKAQQYASENIKNSKSRDAFLKHMQNMVSPSKQAGDQSKASFQEKPSKSTAKAPKEPEMER